jgi:hypothetical protein
LGYGGAPIIPRMRYMTGQYIFVYPVCNFHCCVIAKIFAEFRGRGAESLPKDV